MAAWADVPFARLHWKDAEAMDDPVVLDLLQAATDELTDFAPTPLPETIPFRYKLASVYCARSYVAGMKSASDDSGPDPDELLATAYRLIRAKPRPSYKVG